MKKLVLALALLAGPTSVAAAEQDFTILNKTGYPIERIYVSASSKDDWE